MQIVGLQQHKKMREWTTWVFMQIACELDTIEQTHPYATSNPEEEVATLAMERNAETKAA